MRADDLTPAQQVSLLSGRGYWHTQDIPEAGIGSTMISDGPHGLRVQGDDPDRVGVASSHPATCFPTAVALASTWDEQLLADVGRALGIEALALGQGVVLGPGMNLKRHPLCGRNFEYLSEDPLLTGRLAAAMVAGIQSQGVGACLKHYAVNNQESHRFVVDAVVDERTLRETYLAGFEHAVTASRPWVVMAAYNSVNGEPCTHNVHLLADILRDEWGFDGLVVSDWGATVDRVRALQAGMDLEMPGSRGVFDDEVVAAVRSGALDAGTVTRSAQRVLDMVDRAPHRASGTVPVDAHDALARRAAAAGSVLLTNDGLLPLDPGRSIGVIGAFAERPRYQGHGSSHVTPTRLTAALQALEARGIAVTFAPGYDPTGADDDERLVDDAVDVAREVDVAVVMVGLPDGDESEGFDRDHLRLPAQHDTLVAAVCAANRRTVVVLSNGAPVLMPWRHAPAAILECYLGGQASGAALVDILLGASEPGGRLAETFPRAQGDIAADPWFPGDTRQVHYREGVFVGYRHHVTAGVEPAFPFGHGLGYATFAWGQPNVEATTLVAGDGTTVAVPVTNTGARPGSDVVQVYLSDRTGVVLRPLRELAGFAKVRLDPGHSTVVDVEVTARAFAHYDVDAHDWRTPQGSYLLEVARSSTDVVHTVEVQVVEGVTTAAEPPTQPMVAASDAAFERRLGRPIPTPRPSRPFTRESTIGELRAVALGRLVHRALLRAASHGQDDSDDAHLQAMIQRAIEEMPLRAVALLSGGRIRWGTVDVLVDLLNGQPVQAGRRLAAAARRALRPT